MRQLLVYSARNGSWLLLKSGANFLLSLLTLTLFAHYTSKETVGIYSYAGTLGTIAGLFSLPGMAGALTRSVARGFEASLARMMRLQFRWGLLGSLALACAALWYWTAGQTALAIVLAVVSICVPVLDNPATLASAFWRGRQQFSQDARYAVLRVSVQAALIVPAFFLIRNSAAIVSACYIAACVSGGMTFLLALRRSRPSPPDAENERLGKHLTLMQVLSVVGGNADRIVIWHFLGPAVVAIYAVGYGPISRLNFLIPANFLVLPLVSKKDLSAAIKRKVLRFSLLGLALLAPFALGLYLAAPVFYETFFPGYGASIPLFRAFLPLVVIGPVNAFIRTAFIGTGEAKKLYVTSIAVPVVKLALLLALVPFWGLWGAVVAALAGAVVMAAVNFRYLLS